MHIKKLVMHGFKSFPKKTELFFTPEINVILGPNGSGKSNISDALCFVLGRLSAKSIRASKTSNLIFLGSKEASPAKEAMVELVFENKDRIFSIDSDEVSIKRIVRRNGLGIYKINDETKTRQEILLLLSQGGIDSNGFNLVLQGEIQNFVRMHPEERRRVIEEVSGISVYEIRKERSLKELTKTEEKLKEVHAILRERTSYLNNLERERQQALRFKKLEGDAKRLKASIIYGDLTKKKKESEALKEEIEKKNKETEKIKKSMTEIQTGIKNSESKIDSINSTIQKSTGFEQEKLNQEIANLRAELAGLNVRTDNYEKKLSELHNEKGEIQRTISENDSSVKELQRESPSLAKKQKDVEAKKIELEKLEKQRKNFYAVKSELKSAKERLDDKKNLLNSYLNESEFLLKQIEHLSEELFDKKTDEAKINSLKVLLDEKKSSLNNLVKKETELQRISYLNAHEIGKKKNFAEKILKMDICPVCKSKITNEHAHSIKSETDKEVNAMKTEIDGSDKELGKISGEKEILRKEIENISSELKSRESDLVKLSGINEKKDGIKTLQKKIDSLKIEISELEKTRKKLEEDFNENSHAEQRYENMRIDVQEISLRTEENLDTEITFKKRELERARVSLKAILNEEEDLQDELSESKKTIEEKESLLDERREQEEELNRKFQGLISERDSLHKKIRDEESKAFEKQNLIHNVENQINNINIDIARVNAEVENLETDMLDFSGVEIIKANKDSLINRLNSVKEILLKIGSVNLLSLEVYDSVKKEYDSVNEKAGIIDREKEEILKIIHEIDIKKKKTFLKTLNELNEIFSRNFSRLSSKGAVSLEPENKKEIFDDGVNIIVKTGHGKYFDAASLSGGEQTLVALSLIFAIQEYKPYYFYIFDEVDAALDKRNSERLAELLKKHMQKGQYIIITHNDEIILNATNLYGVSMHEGISKVVSLKV